MARIASDSLVRSLGSLFDGGSVAGLSDRQLLERFTAARDSAGEAAFAALVARHGPMVLDLCHQLLGDLHHAEDAFQAVFLVLARRSQSIRDPDLLANWLYGVALRTARCAKRQHDCRRKKEEADTMRRPVSGSPSLLEEPVQPAEQPMIDREQAEALHSEISRLPTSFRLAVVLCYFDGLTLDEAARRLRCPAGTLRSRLARARDNLRRALTRRGVILPAAALAAALAPRSASASITSHLCETTAHAATQFAVGQSAAPLASALALEVLKSMLFHKLKFLALAVLLFGAVATSAGFLTLAPATNDEPQTSRPAKKPDPAVQGRMTVAGRVLDPAGKPVANVSVDVIGRPRTPSVADNESMNPRVLLGRGETDTDGRFQFDAARTASTRFFEIHALASFPGFGLGWAELNPDAEKPGSDIGLRREQVIRGKLVDLSGQPAAGVELRITSVGRPTDIGTFDGVSLWDARLAGMRVWPRPVTTDQEGRFTVVGIGRDVNVSLEVRDLRFARRRSRSRRTPRMAQKRRRWSSNPRRSSRGASSPPTPASPYPARSWPLRPARANSVVCTQPDSSPTLEDGSPPTRRLEITSA